MEKSSFQIMLLFNGFGPIIENISSLSKHKTNF